MTDMATEVTHLVERIDALEERFAISIEALYAEYDPEGTFNLRVLFDVVATNGTIDENIEMVVAVYNEKGQLIDTHSAYLFAEEFVGIKPIESYFDCSMPAKVRIYPTP